MNREQSVYLDILRVVAAATVFIGHLEYFAAGDWGAALQLAHGSVVVFFVLSGFVIAFVTSTKENEWRVYAAHRLARIYSVALPAVALTVILDTYGYRHGYTNDFYRPYQIESWPKYAISSLAFVSEIWFRAETMFSNGPFWSLTYEVWYYVLFAVLVFVRGWQRMAGALLVALIVGPRLWVLFPVWGVGWWLAARQEHWTAPTTVARLVFAVTTALVPTLVLSGIGAAIENQTNNLSGGVLRESLRFSRNFVFDYLIALIVAVNIWSVRHADLGLHRLGGMPARLATCAFTLYLAHFPLLGFWSNVVPDNVPVLIIATLLTIILLALVTERQKSAWQRFFRRILGAHRTPPSA